MAIASGSGTTRENDLFQCGPRDVVHHQVGHIVLSEEIANPHNVGMTAQRQSSRLILTAPGQVVEMGTAPTCLVQGLNHNPLTQRMVERFEGNAEASFSKDFFQRVFPRLERFANEHIDFQERCDRTEARSLA